MNLTEVVEPSVLVNLSKVAGYAFSFAGLALMGLLGFAGLADPHLFGGSGQGRVR